MLAARKLYLAGVVCAILLVLFATSSFRAGEANAAPVLTIAPITWNVIGLDSNNVSVGPDTFPVGARVCNTGDATATNVASSFVWDSANSLINLSGAGTLSAASLSAGACTDFYYSVVVTRNS